MNTRWIVPVLLLSLISISEVSSQTAEFDNDILQGEFWALLEPLNSGELERMPLDPAIVKNLLEEARWIFSGMIYGWEFTYRPSDKARGAIDFLEVKPLGSIVWGDRHLDLSKSRTVEKESRLYVELNYSLTPFEFSRRKAWLSLNTDQIGGRGTEKIVGRLQSRIEALNQALKEAVRNYLRPRLYNKPQEVMGEVLLRKVPVFGTDSGSFVCSAQFQLKIKKIRDYPAF